MLDKAGEGKKGEDKAIKALKRHGYKIIERNYRSPFGEIDIIAKDGDCLCFIEVKKRNLPFFGDPLEAIDTRKMVHIIKTATFYLKRHKLLEANARFDVVGIAGENVKIVRNAFSIEDG